jgi:hypothetical protein
MDDNGVEHGSEQVLLARSVDLVGAAGIGSVALSLVKPVTSSLGMIDHAISSGIPADVLNNIFTFINYSSIVVGAGAISSATLGFIVGLRLLLNKEAMNQLDLDRLASHSVVASAVLKTVDLLLYKDNQ